VIRKFFLQHHFIFKFKRMIINKIAEIAQILTSETVSEIGLLTGIGGQILVCSELFLHNKIPQKWLLYLHQVLEKKLAEENFITTHCGGLAGIGWLYEYLSQRNVLNEDTNLLLEDFDTYLEQSLINFMQRNSYDFLHGGVGVALYFTKRVAKKKELVSVLNQFLVDLEKISIQQEDGAIKWFSFLGEQHNPQNGYNISLSHGISSIISILSKLHRIEGIDNREDEEDPKANKVTILSRKAEKEKRRKGEKQKSRKAEDTLNPNIQKEPLGAENSYGHTLLRSYGLPCISIQNLTFQYDGPHSETVLDNVNLEIPSGKVTAIVGMSGSGKTTLVKLMLGFYPPVKGEIKIGEYNLQNISTHIWREHCGAVMQDGFIFSDTIARNIAVSDEIIDTNRLLHAAKVANIQEMVEGLPLGFNTKIGQEGQGISQGQRQRILIARAVYKNPEYIFFDEATNALDANNEKVIMENLNEFFQGKTVVIVAHRLSTVKNADNIVVLEKGKIVEQGTHKELTALRGVYYELVKNQLELGN